MTEANSQTGIGTGRSDCISGTKRLDYEMIVIKYTTRVMWKRGLFDIRHSKNQQKSHAKIKRGKKRTSYVCCQGIAEGGGMGNEGASTEDSTKYCTIEDHISFLHFFIVAMFLNLPHMHEKCACCSFVPSCLWFELTMSHAFTSFTLFLPFTLSQAESGKSHNLIRFVLCILRSLFFFNRL